MKKDTNIWLGNNNTDKLFWDSQSQRSPHLVLIGGSGSGKTETLKVISMELKNKKVSTLIIDFHNDFTILADNLIKLDNTTIHPLEIQVGERPIDVTYKIAKIFAKIFSLGEIQEAIIREAIKTFYQDSKIKDLKKENSGNFKLLPFSHFKEILENNFERRKTESLLAKLSIVFDTDIFMDAKETSLPFNTMTTQVSVIQLKEFPTDEIKSMIAEIILNKLINYFYLKGQSKEGIELFCIIDEAHRVTYEGSPVDLLLRESRKYGVGVILASQRPTDFSETILANVGTIMSFQCSLAKDAKYLSNKSIRTRKMFYQVCIRKLFKKIKNHTN
ncbi:ATP-binding protein [Candidatus Woesearchaeota archaeon]|nr:ATP-binding protein [Candidatus Woesearchaeota archaeon]